ncbi:tetratricopeptide repeat protein [Streptomyces sp. NPDC058052]|uniref:SEL1-like repeat protein n=1 Tax=Streptomyces sp. NPDC058052 TaxID=3346316 RepID=UPI0036E12814
MTRDEGGGSRSWWPFPGSAGAGRRNGSTGTREQGERLLERGRIVPAEAILRPLAEGGDAEAMFLLAALHTENGDSSKAASWMRRAARAPRGASVDAMIEYGRTHKDEDDREDWFARAERTLAAAADPDDIGVLTSLCRLHHLRGDTARADEVLERAKELYGTGDGAVTPETRYRLASLCDLAGATEDATRWCRSAAEAGHATAMFALGSDLHGEGRVDEAARWWRRAVRAGCARSAFNMSHLAETPGGYGSPVRWLKEAAKAGNPSAMNNLGILYRHRGDHQRARRWYADAIAAGHQDARHNLDGLHAEMAYLAARGVDPGW